MNEETSLKFTDEQFMRKALELAGRARGRTSPNPIVGCVLVKNGQIIGEGYHQKAGTPHAEVHALKAAQDQAFGATAYVTLEPCSHFGRTPPCADALIRAGIQRVVIAMEDPNPLVSGRGIERLREAGIQVDVGILHHEAATLNEAFCKTMTANLPFVVYKTAMTLDGKIATESGDSRWVSNETSRRYVHQLRDYYDVILVGSETVLRDNPALTCRLPGGRDPVRLVVDGELRLPESSHVLTSSPSSPCIIATTKAAPSDKLERLKKLEQVEIWQYNTSRHVPLKKMLQDLVQRGWISVLLEGGGRLAGALIQEQCIDKLDCFIAPKLVGGSGPSPLSGLHIQRMNEAIELYDLSVDKNSGDIHVTGYFRHD
ncbi:bifunctional diaminohydroxyphosphoribosylaminopyrimidine deaminase/5-amino-6-(5-phosphoribosylamino)uracil reductase RibD [Desulfosporosinus sp. PR]|uniref:bifunctional diaminohydroxyphosphoribosylaminopyrimidine deaminase/5-amino-6-(5-phosphoribosylamino)uracil reductase RibD n=1 Tax=Candidatus Desulfosporosinus nitrosoreducens TaxID=3401928 RepID=UPI0027F7A325|nr:bifunctional diaminohydroxyphosphoribosylaminopyrimidine deaminase/5-amino-6-(5-phosphoribosylamino)uracil reductase RibD [Desulfosporosinus sp. PR]MDQ7094938.1 bifunctional diaminohydroxyphosphoribosylaminopyrimidine deaminase/5-amino-6-(5-phosphoribosylamino)uracil reductase RibD [Desulfosporosinus sp. PR]